jgi:hypothetical protein
MLAITTTTAAPEPHDPAVARLARLGAIVVGDYATMTEDARHAFRFTPSGRARRDAVVVYTADGRALAARRHPWQVTDGGRTVIVEHAEDAPAAESIGDDDEPRAFGVRMTGTERTAYDYDGDLPTA